MTFVDKKTIGERIIEISKKSKMTLKDFAVELDIPYSNLQKYATGVSKPTAGLYIALYDVGVNLHWFVSGQGAMFRGAVNETPASDGTEAKKINNDRGLIICDWIKHYMNTHSKDEQAWFDVELSRQFPQYKEWKEGK